MEQWRAEHQHNFESWLDAWAEFEALQALATYAYERPGGTFPEFVEGPSLVEAEQLGHPLLEDDVCVCIPLAVTLFNIFRGDLLGLIVDYAEIANVQETVLLEDTAELYDPAIHGEDADRVSMEVENLERALTYRAELRVTAYQILNQLGIASQARN